MATCRKCPNNIPSSILIEGKRRILSNRKYCLTCSPWGQHNTRILDGDPLKRKSREARDKNIECVIAYRQRTKLKAIAYKGGKCERCPYDRCVSALTFHHLDPSQKDFTISHSTRRWEVIQVELDKCIMLCRNCHAEEHDRLYQQGLLEKDSNL